MSLRPDWEKPGETHELETSDPIMPWSGFTEGELLVMRRGLLCMLDDVDVTLTRIGSDGKIDMEQFMEQEKELRKTQVDCYTALAKLRRFF